MSAAEEMARLARGTVEIVPAGGLAEKLDQARRTGVPLRVKLGLDPSTPDLHLGHSIVLRKLRQFQDLGHIADLVIGTFTGMIGDPSGTSVTRRQLSPEEVVDNAQTYVTQYSCFLDAERTQVTFNGQWLGSLHFHEAIGLCSKITLARILERDDFARRYRDGLPIGVHELMYPLCQAYDSVHLGSDVEMGGTDQRFNILMGRDLQREFGQEPQVALFMPLLVGLDGEQKMSKSLGNTIGVREAPLEMFSKVMSLADGLMRDYYEYLTELPMPEAEALIAAQPMEAKKQLGERIVDAYHPAGSGTRARADWERIHSDRSLPAEIPEVALSPEILDGEGRIWIVQLLKSAGLAQGTNEARRAVEQGGVLLDGDRCSDPAAQVQARSGMVIQIGRRRFARVLLKE